MSLTMERSLLLTILSTILTVTLALQDEEPQLRLVNVVFRHGDRAPDPLELYPTDPYRHYDFYPMGRGGLTNEGKLREYQLGNVLKTLYGSFLGPVYEPWVLEARSTDYDRTKMSLQLVLSALYPPTPIQQWSDNLQWQPIPTMYRRKAEDVLLLPDLCPKYLAEYNRAKTSPEVLAKLSKFTNLMQYIEKHSGRPIRTPYDLYDMYHIFTAQTAMNLTLPDWTNEVYPDGELLKGAMLEYEVMGSTEFLRKINGGVLVRKMSEDLVSYRSRTLPAGRKLFLYSAHETNIGAVLNTLGVFEPHIPAYSSAVMLELWQKGDEYFVKVRSYAGIPSEVTVKTIPGCEEFCPLDKFLELMKPVTPSDGDLICVKDGSSRPQGAQKEKVVL